MSSDDSATRIRVIASDSTWMEGEALRQLEATAAWPGMRRVVGLPDLHPGKGSPVGAAFLAEDILYPTLVGSDIGCGIGLWTTGLPARKARPERIATRLDGLDRPWEGDRDGWLERAGLAPTPHDAGLGTPGRGNHFCEVQAVHAVHDAARFAGLGLDADRLVFLVHSGSRGLGEAILRDVASRHGAVGIAAGSDAAKAYQAEHDRAVSWAAANRSLCAYRMMKALGTEGARILDVCHNAVVPVSAGGCRCWLHRKGAAPADQGPVVIPGSRGDLSMLVQPVAEGGEALWSLAHGAGRKIPRAKAKGMLQRRYRREDLATNRWGGRVVCGDELLAWEEMADAYKDIASVVGDLEQAGLLTVIASLRPVVTFKTSLEPRHDGRHDWQEDRRAARRAKQGGRG